MTPREIRRTALALAVGILLGGVGATWQAIGDLREVRDSGYQQGYWQGGDDARAELLDRLNDGLVGPVGLPGPPGRAGPAGPAGDTLTDG